MTQRHTWCVPSHSHGVRAQSRAPVSRQIQQKRRRPGQQVNDFLWLPEMLTAALEAERRGSPFTTTMWLPEGEKFLLWVFQDKLPVGSSVDSGQSLGRRAFFPRCSVPSLGDSDGLVTSSIYRWPLTNRAWGCIDFFFFKPVFWKPESDIRSLQASGDIPTPVPHSWKTPPPPQQSTLYPASSGRLFSHVEFHPSPALHHLPCPPAWSVLHLIAQLCPTLCNPLECSPPGSSVQGILQVRTLEWVAMPSSREPPSPRDRTHISWVSRTGRWVFRH